MQQRIKVSMTCQNTKMFALQRKKFKIKFRPTIFSGEMAIDYIVWHFKMVSDCRHSCRVCVPSSGPVPTHHHAVIVTISTETVLTFFCENSVDTSWK